MPEIRIMYILANILRSNNKDYTMIKNVIVITNEYEDRKEVYGALLTICKLYKFPYHQLVRNSWPFYYDGWKFEKIKYNTNI